MMELGSVGRCKGEHFRQKEGHIAKALCVCMCWGVGLESVNNLEGWCGWK